MRVCPKCKTDERLYSVELMEVMYPVKVSGSVMSYTGGESVKLDETAEHKSVHCRSCDWGGDLADLVEEEGEEEPDPLSELVHDVASQQASNAINSGQEREFLLAAGWTEKQIKEGAGPMINGQVQVEVYQGAVVVRHRGLIVGRADRTPRGR